MMYLKMEYPVVRRVQKFRTADIIRVRAFILIFKQTFEELQLNFANTFASKK